MTPKVQATEKKDKLGLNQKQKFFASKGTMKRVKRQPTEWKTIFANHTSDKCLVSRTYKEILQLNKKTGTSLVAQWLRIHLPMQGTRVWALVREDPTRRRATKPMCHNYWACTLEPVSHNYWAHKLQLLKPVRLEPMLCNKRNHHNEKHVHCN